MNPPVVQTQMLIRKPAADVYRAFVDPAVTTRFWFTRSTGKLEPGASVEWTWEMYGVSAAVRVLEMEPDRKIRIEWGDPPTTVSWGFDPRGDAATLVRIENEGFSGGDDEMAAGALNAMGGFTYLLAGLKAFLEHGVSLNLVADHHPDAHLR